MCAAFVNGVPLILECEKETSAMIQTLLSVDVKDYSAVARQGLLSQSDSVFFR